MCTENETRGENTLKITKSMYETKLCYENWLWYIKKVGERKRYSKIIISNAVVTPLRKAASYEQRKTNLGNQNFRRRIIT